jgi:hypothetical protein
VLQAKTHFKQVPIEIVRSILDGQDQQEKGGTLGAEGGKKLREKDSLRTKKSHLRDPAFSPEVEKRS